MTIQAYGPTIFPVLPADASEVSVTRQGGGSLTFTTPVTVNPATHAVSFAVDDHGSPPVGVIIKVTSKTTGKSTTVRAMLPPPVASGGTGGPETDPVAGPRVTAETSRAQAAEAAEAVRAEAAEAAAATSAALTSETSRATVAEQAASTAASTEAARAQSAESVEATRAQAAEAANTATISGHVNSTAAHSADNITFNDSGLIVVKGAKVKAALAAVDVWINARPTNEAGTLLAMPANGARPDGSTYLATDQYGGTTYRMVAGVWTQQSAGVTQASGQMVAGPVSMNGTANVDLKAIGAVATDVPGMSVAVPAYARGVLLRAKFEVQANSGTAAAGTYVRVLLLLTDAANAIIGAGQVTFVQVIAAAQVFGGQVVVEKYLPAPVAGGTYKLRAQLAAAAPANWTSALLFPGNGSGGASSEDYFYAQAV